MAQSKGTVNGTANTDTLVAFGEGLQVDRLKLHKAVLSEAGKGEKQIAIILQLLDDSFWSEVHNDPRVLDADGKPFKTWGLWFAFVMQGFPVAREVLGKPVVAKMLAKASVREVVAATGWSRGYVHEVNLERQGKTSQTSKAKRAARPNDGSKGAKGATTEATTEAVTELAKGADVARIVTALVPLLAKAVDLIAEMDATTLAAFNAATGKAHTAAAAMVQVNAKGAAIAAAKADQAEEAVKATA